MPGSFEITQEMVENTAQTYAELVDRITGGAELDHAVDAGEWSGPASDRALTRESDQLFIKQAETYGVDVNELKYKVYEFLNTPDEDIDHSGAPRIA